MVLLKKYNASKKPILENQPPKERAPNIVNIQNQ